MLVEEGTYISSHKGELLNSKSEWHQAKIIRTTTRVVQGGAESLRQGGGGAVGGGGGPQGGRARTGDLGTVEFFYKTSKSDRFSFWFRNSL